MLSTYFHNLAFPTVHQAIGNVHSIQQEYSTNSNNNDSDLNDMMQEVLLMQTSGSSSSSSVLYNNNGSNSYSLPSPLSTPALSLLHQQLSQKIAQTQQQEVMMADQQSAVIGTVVPSTMVQQQSSNSSSPITPSTSFVQLSSNAATALTDSDVEQPQNDYQLEDLAVIRLRPAKKKYGIANLTWNNFDIPELHSGTYRYILQIDMSKHCANIVATQEKFAFALLVESSNSGDDHQQAGNNDEATATAAAVDGWQKVNDKYGGNGLKEMSFAQFVNGLPNVLEFSLKFSVNSHEFKKKPFKFQVYFMGALIFESIPFKLVAHKDKRNDIFNKDTYGKKNVAKRAYTKKQQDAAADEGSKKKSSPSKKHSRQQQQIDEQAAHSKKRRMSSSSLQGSSGSSSEDEHEDDAASPKSSSPTSALSSASFALTIPMQFILNNPILRQACEQHATTTVSL